MKALSSIVVGIDFSECSRVALTHALRMASWSKVSVHPVHVVEVTMLDYVAHDAPPGSLQQQIHAGLVDEATRRWVAFSESIPGARDLPIDVLIGSRLSGIREQLARYNADLLVLGAYGACKPNLGLGTVASGCIRGVPVDVLVVRDNYRDAFRTVAVGIDLSAACRGALEAAAFVAHHEGARLFAVHVAADNVDTYSHLLHELQPKLQDFVATTSDRYPALDVRCHVYPYSGYRSGILKFASLVNADVVMIGKKGRASLRDTVLGSTAEKVLRDSVVAVWAAAQDSRP